MLKKLHYKRKKVRLGYYKYTISFIQDIPSLENSSVCL